MPPVTLPSEESLETNAFTVLNNEGSEDKSEDITVVVEFSVPPGKSVNVVKPLQRQDERNHLNSAQEARMTAPVGPRSILDPTFSRALDFKLRRLKVKEVNRANTNRPSRFRPKNRSIAASNPNVSEQAEAPIRKMSRSQPRIDVAPPEDIEYLKSTDKSPLSPNRRSKRKASGPSDGSEKPRFITTVKTGRFLLPPPELACLLGLEALYPPEEREVVYSYSSKPKPVPSRSKRSVNAGTCGEVRSSVVQPSPKKQCAGNAFSGVRALVAGVVGMKSLIGNRDKHIDGSTSSLPYANVMHEKRVVRGSTYALQPSGGGAGAGDAESAAARAARTRRRAMARRAAAARLRPGTPPAAPGRKHHPIQTEYYLEELFDKGEEMEVGVQTDLFLDRPTTPIYVPAKTGADAFTQIYPGDLFDFDLEVQPILEVLVGKSAEQALSEVAQEEELATLREQQRRFVELRDAERAERERLIEQDRRLETEKERRIVEARAARISAVETKERAAAATLVQGYLADLLPSVLEGLRDQGYLFERIERSVDEDFLPWLTEAVALEVESIITSRDVITEIVRDVVEARGELYRGAGERGAEEALAEPLESETEPSAPSEGGEEEMEPQEE